MDESDESTPLGNVEAEIKELLGLFDVPAFARRGQDLEYALARLRVRARRHRAAILDMVRLRLRQWASAASGAEGGIDLIFELLDRRALAVGRRRGPEVDSPIRSSPRRLRAIARDLVASVERFNRRWLEYLEGIWTWPFDQPPGRRLQPLLPDREGMQPRLRPGWPPATSSPRPRVTVGDLLDRRCPTAARADAESLRARGDHPRFRVWTRRRPDRGMIGRRPPGKARADRLDPRGGGFVPCESSRSTIAGFGVADRPGW